MIGGYEDLRNEVCEILGGEVTASDIDVAVVAIVHEEGLTATTALAELNVLAQTDQGRATLRNLAWQGPAKAQDAQVLPWTVRARAANILAAAQRRHWPSGGVGSSHAWTAILRMPSAWWFQPILPSGAMAPASHRRRRTGARAQGG